MPDVAQRLAQQRRAFGHERASAQRSACRVERADRERAVRRGCPSSAGHAVEVDQRARPGEPQVEHRHEALPARQQLRVVAELGEQRERLLDGLGGVVRERGRFHGAASLPGLGSGAIGQMAIGQVTRRRASCPARGLTPSGARPRRRRVRENRGLDGTWISWAVVGCGAAVLWSCVGIDRTRRAALHRRLLLGGGLVVLGFASFAVTGGSSDTPAEARRVADAFTLARMTDGRAAARRFLAPAAAPLAERLPVAPPGTPAGARRLVATGVSLDCGQTPILQSGPPAERCVVYGDGSRVFLWRDGGDWYVVGFTVR